MLATLPDEVLLLIFEKAGWHSTVVAIRTHRRFREMLSRTVKYLLLTKERHTESFIRALRQYRTVRSIEVRGTTLPRSHVDSFIESLHAADHLESLCLENNNIGSKAVPLISNLMSLRSLTSLNLAYAEINSDDMQNAHELLGNLPLQQLRLGGNPLGDRGVSFLSISIPAMTQLLLLDLGDVSLSGSGCMALGNALRHLTTLTYLDICYNKLNAEAISWGLQNLCNLTHLDLSGPVSSLKTHREEKSGIGPDGMVFVAAAIAKCTALTHLALDNNSMEDMGAQALGASLAALSRLQHIRLADNGVKSAGLERISLALFAHAAIASLDLSVNEIREEAMRHVAVMLASSANNITSLNISYNQLGHGGASQLAAVIDQLRNLKYIALASTRLGTAAAAVCAALASLSALTHLDLGYNQLGSETGSCIATLLPNLPSLSLLDLGYNAFGAQGTTAIASTLSTCKNLSLLALGYNRLGDKGVMALCNAISNMPKMTHLELKYNQIGQEGAEHLRVLYARSTSLQHSDIADNRIADLGANSLFQVVIQASRFVRINISHNGVTDQQIEKMRRECSAALSLVENQLILMTPSRIN